MSFESAISIRPAIREIKEGRWVIPAFQRQLVGRPDPSHAVEPAMPGQVVVLLEDTIPPGVTAMPSQVG